MLEKRSTGMSFGEKPKEKIIILSPGAPSQCHAVILGCLASKPSVLCWQSQHGLGSGLIYAASKSQLPNCLFCEATGVISRAQLCKGRSPTPLSPQTWTKAKDVVPCYTLPLPSIPNHAIKIHTEGLPIFSIPSSQSEGHYLSQLKEQCQLLRLLLAVLLCCKQVFNFFFLAPSSPQANWILKPGEVTLVFFHK